MSDTFPLLGSISHGSLHAYDLFAAFVPALRTVDPAAYAQIFCPAVGFVQETYARAMEERRGSDFWESEECAFMMEELSDALSDAAPDGYYFGAHEGDGSDFGFWETEEHAAEREWAVFTDTLAVTGRPGRSVDLCGESPADTFTVFVFGAYGDTVVAVGHGPGLTSLEACLEVAAEKLKEIAPGMFVEPDYRAAADELGVPYDSEFGQEKAAEKAEVDLTYTEIGFLPSSEWTIAGERMTRAELLAYADR